MEEARNGGRVERGWVVCKLEGGVLLSSWRRRR
jgi:hypothetical protein